MGEQAAFAEQSEAVIDIGIVLGIGKQFADEIDFALALREMRSASTRRIGTHSNSPDTLSCASLEVMAKRGVTA